MVLARFVLLAAFLLAASSVSAAVTIDLGPSDYRNWGTGTNSHTGAGIRSSTGQTVRIPPLNGNLNVTRNAVIPYGSLANGMRNFVRINPASVAASAAVTGLFLAMDWVFDQEMGEWVKLEENVIEDPELGLFTGTLAPVDTFYPTASEACIAGNTNPVFQFSHVNNTSPIAYQCMFVNQNNGNIQQVGGARQVAECPQGVLNLSLGACVYDDYISLDSSDWSELAGYLPSANADQVGQAGNDTQRMIGNPLPGFQDQTMTGPSSIAGPETTSTSTDPVTGDTVVTNTQTTTNITYGDTTITTTNTTVTNTYTNGNHTSTETTTETPGELPVTEPSPGGAAGEWPGFCDWASVVCNFIDWFQEPFDAPDVEWPLIEDQDFEEEFDYTLAASCPEPYTIELALFPPVQFNWQPFCDLASFIKPLVLASAAIFAAFISLGIARART